MSRGAGMRRYVWLIASTSLSLSLATATIAGWRGIITSTRLTRPRRHPPDAARPRPRADVCACRLRGAARGQPYRDGGAYRRRFDGGYAGRDDPRAGGGAAGCDVRRGAGQGVA